MKSFLKRIINSALRPFGLVLRRDTLPGSQQMRTFNAVYCGNNRLLTTHPVRGLMYVDSTDVSVTPGVVMGSYEPHVQAVLMRLIKPGFVVVEGGANQGVHTLTMATMVGRTGRVLAFEPDPRNCDVLKLNIRTHYMSDLVIPFNKALLDRNAEIRFYSTLAGGHSHVHYSYPESTNSLFPTNYDLALAAESEILVEAVRAGDILKKMGLKPDFVRLDVQGAEPEALDGMWEYLEGASETMILFEYAPICLKLAGHDSPTDFVHRLAGLGMKFHRIEPDGSLKLVDAESLKLVQDDQVEDYVAARQPL